MKLKEIRWVTRNIEPFTQGNMHYYGLTFHSEEEAIAGLEHPQIRGGVVKFEKKEGDLTIGLLYCTRENGEWRIERPTYELTDEERLMVARYVQRHHVPMSIAGNFPERYICMPGGATPTLFYERDEKLYDAKTIAFENFSIAVYEALTKDLVDASIQRYLDRFGT